MVKHFVANKMKESPVSWWEALTLVEAEKSSFNGHGPEIAVSTIAFVKKAVGPIDHRIRPDSVLFWSDRLFSRVSSESTVSRAERHAAWTGCGSRKWSEPTLSDRGERSPTLSVCII